MSEWKWTSTDALKMNRLSPGSVVLEECLQTVECWEVEGGSEVASLNLWPPEWDLLSSAPQKEEFLSFGVGWGTPDPLPPPPPPFLERTCMHMDVGCESVCFFILKCP